MAEIAPLTPLRYDLNKLPHGLGPVIAPPYDVISPEQREALAATDPHNVVRLILPEGEGDSKYANAATILSGWRQSGVLVRDDVPGFYRYDQRFTPPGGGAALMRRGFLALVRVVPFSERVVLPHERTLSGPKEDRLKLFRATRTNLSPGFMLYSDPQLELRAALETARLLAEFRTEDGVEHALAKIEEPDAMRAIVRKVAESSLLIADGHHRYETALRYANETSAAHPGAHERAAHRYFMVFLTNGDDPSLVVFPTHRHVHSLAQFHFDEVVAKLAALFDIAQRGPAESGSGLTTWLSHTGTRPAFVMAGPDGRAALLTLRGDVNLASHPTLGRLHAKLRETDVAILHAGILEHVLGITPEAQAAKTNIWYPQDADLAWKDLRSGKGQVLFLMKGTPVRQVREVAMAGEVMPQKSTFFFPKIMTGLAMHTLEHDRAVPLV